MPHILALDQGTTSSRAILFDDRGQPVRIAQREFEQIFPQPGHVEHNPEEIWKSQLATAREVLESSAVDLSDIKAIGITNQRETVLIWDRESGQPVANAMVWQSRITTARCEQLKADGLRDEIQQKTGLIIDPYFSATKIEHLLKTIPGLQQRAEQGEVLCGTIETFLIWRLTGGRSFVTDISNASRTMLFNIHTLDWDADLLKLFNIPREMLPEVRSNSEVLGETDKSLFGVSLPIAGSAGDQQAATYGQACFRVGDAKNTYGTGCFMLMNIGPCPRTSANGLLTTVAWKIGDAVTYALEGSIFIAGAVVQWLRDGLGIISTSEEVEQLATSVPDTDGVYFVPAFVGLGTPYWDASARGTIVGITRGTTKAHIARAAVESMAFQTMEVLTTMQQDSGIQLGRLKVDGGASVNDGLMQFQANLLNTTVLRPKVSETTALGAAYLAGLAVGVWRDQAELAKQWTLDKTFEPEITEEERKSIAHNWHRAVERSRGWAE